MKPVLSSPSALWRKLEREAYRAFHAKRPLHKADHFFNFCVTAHSLRDFYLHVREVPRGKPRGRYHATWDSNPLLVAVKEIANLTKHFELTDFRTGESRQPETRAVTRARTEVVDVFVNAAGDIRLHPREARTLVVTTSDAVRYDLSEFVHAVLEYWLTYLKNEGIVVRRQPLTNLLDE